MGTDKAFIQINDRPLITVALDALVGADAITIVGGDPARFDSLGVAHLPDAEPGQGPLNGLVTALDASDAPLTVVLPCDLLAVTPTGVQRMISALGDADCIVPLIRGRAAWIPSVWRTGAVDHLRTNASARGSIRGAIRGLRIVHFVDIRPDEWRDADRPDDLPADVSTNP